MFFGKRGAIFFAVSLQISVVFRQPLPLIQLSVTSVKSLMTVKFGAVFRVFPNCHLQVLGREEEDVELSKQVFGF